MKKAFLLTLPLILAASSTIDTQLLHMQKQIQTLQKQLAEQQADMSENMPILEEVEKKSILDKLNLSPELLLRFDKFKYVNKGIVGENTKIIDPRHPMFGEQRRDEFRKNYDIAASVRFRLNMNMTLDDIKFHGRLLYMNATQANQRICILSRDIKTGTAGSAFDVDRAYIDYALNKNSEYTFTFSFGLLPTSGGTPMQYATDSKRMSMFPALVFDMNTFGVIGTQKLADKTFARVILAKPYTLRANFYPYQCNRENVDNADIAGIYADTTFHFLGKALLSFGVNMMHDLKAHPYLGPDVNAADAKKLGTMFTYGLGVDIENIAHSGTTAFVHTAFSNPHPNGEKDDYKIVSYTPDYEGETTSGDIGFTEADYASGTMLTQNGYSIYLGTKYTINPQWSAGAEYNHGSQYWFSATQGAEDMFNKLATRGNAYEAYGTWKYHKYLSAKLSYLQIEEQYTGSGWHFGEPASKDATQRILSLSLEAKF